MKMREIYMDHAATTRVRKEVADIMVEYMKNNFGNPSSVHNFGREAKSGLEHARKQIAAVINSSAEEIIFTSGGTEANNLAVIGTARANKDKGRHIVTSAIEHHAVLDSCKYLEKEGFEVTYLGVDSEGMISPEDVKEVLREDTILVTIMHVNNEVGTIQPIKDIAQLAHEKNAVMHTDAVQSFGKINVDVEKLGIDLLSISSHKIYGPKGVGALYIKKGTKINNMAHGGAQEKKKRPGTENLPGIVGFGLAAELIEKEMDKEAERLTKLKEKLIERITTEIDYVKLNGHRNYRIPHNVNVSIQFIEGEALLLSLDMKGIAVSSGSACTSGSLDPSHVLLAMGIPHETAHGSLRISLGKENTEEEIDCLVEELVNIVQRLRNMSPLYNKNA